MRQVKIINMKINYILLPLRFASDKLIGAITQQISSTGLPYSCLLTAAAPSEVRILHQNSQVIQLLYFS